MPGTAWCVWAALGPALGYGVQSRSQGHCAQRRQHHCSASTPGEAGGSLTSQRRLDRGVWKPRRLPGQDVDGADDYYGKDIDQEGHLSSELDGCPGKGWASPAPRAAQDWAGTSLSPREQIRGHRTASRMNSPDHRPPHLLHKP